MKELYDNYYRESFSQNKSQRLDIKTFELNRRKFKWNYDRFFKNIPKDAKILDVGCGLGQFLFYLYKEGFKNISGIDISKPQVELALQMQPQLDIRHIENPSYFLEQHPDKYNIITLNDVLEHIEKDQLISFLSILHHALAPNGLLIIKTINSAYPLGNASRYLDLTHTTSFHEKSLTQLLRHTGFTKISCYQEEIGIYNPLFLVKKSIVITVRFLLKALTYFSESDWPGIISVNLIATGKKIETLK